MSLLKDRQQNKEWEAWKKLCEEIQKTFKITQEEFNSREDVRELVYYIGDWGLEFAKLREMQPDKFGNLVQVPVFYHAGEKE